MLKNGDFSVTYQTLYFTVFHFLHINHFDHNLVNNLWFSKTPTKINAVYEILPKNQFDISALFFRTAEKCY